MIKTEIDHLSGNLSIITIDLKVPKPPKNISELKLNCFIKDIIDHFQIIKSSKMATDFELLKDDSGNITQLLSTTDIFCQFKKSTTSQDIQTLITQINKGLELAF